MKEIEQDLIAKYGTGKESIKDLEEALNLLRIHGEGCEPCIQKEIREKAFKEFKKTET